MAKNALARLGTPTPGSGKIGRRHRYEHEGLADVVTALEAQIGDLQRMLGVPGVAGAPGSSLVEEPGGGENQGTGLGTDHQGTPTPPLVTPPDNGGGGGGAFGLPRGLIVLWDLTLGPIPAGWALCDGSNGTPDIITGNPLLQLSSTSGAVAGANVMFTVSGDTDDATLTEGCVQDGTGAAIQVLTGPTTHHHAVSIDHTFGADILKPNLTRYSLLPIMFVG